MSQLGERLRVAREAQGIAVSQAAADTRILARYIIALEEGDYQYLPGDVYARGFIRNYANYLGLAADELVELYRVDRGVTDPIKIVSATSAPRIRGLFVPSFFGVFFVVLALIVVSYLVLNLTNSLGTRRVADAPVATAAPTPQPLPTWAIEPTNVPQLAAVPTSASVPAAPAPTDQVAGGTVPTPGEAAQTAPIMASVRIAPGDHRGSWIRITVDRTVIFEGVMDAASTRDFAAQTNVKIRVGNAGVVFVTINGVEQGPLGGAGQVFDFAWPPQ